MQIHTSTHYVVAQSRRRIRAALLTSLLVAWSFVAGAQNTPLPSSPENLIKTGQVEQAPEQLDRGNGQGGPGDAYLRGMALYLKGDMLKAASAFEAAAKSHPQNIDAAEMEGVSLFRAGKPAEAARLLEKAREPVRTANVDPKYVLGLCYIDLGRYDDARRTFASQYGFEANSAQSYLLEARMLLRRDYLPIAEVAAQKALELNPSLPKTHLLLGEIALAESQIERALTDFQKERDLDPLDGTAYERMGDAYIRNQDFVHAQEVLDQEILLEPKVSIPYILLGKVLLKQQNSFMAKVYLEHALQMDPNNYVAHFLLGRAYKALGQTEEATKEFQLVSKIQAAATPKLDSAE